MNGEADVLPRVARCLEGLGIDYMIAGSVASSVHGRPRTTHDADIVIDPASGTLGRLVDELSHAGFYVDVAAAWQALLRRRQFNVVDMSSAFKQDLIVRKERWVCWTSGGDS